MGSQWGEVYKTFIKYENFDNIGETLKNIDIK